MRVLDVGLTSNLSRHNGAERAAALLLKQRCAREDSSFLSVLRLLLIVLFIVNRFLADE